MYKCCNCGNLFEEGEQAVHIETHGFNDGYAEHFYTCPVCGGDYEEVHQCKECGDWHTDEELYDGWCEKCLRETINYDTFFEYCEANKDENYLDIFVMQNILNCDEVPKYPSYEFHHLMVTVYKNKVLDVTYHEDMFGPNTSPDAFLDCCIRFIMSDDGSIGRENYADWLNKRGVK